MKPDETAFSRIDKTLNDKQRTWLITGVAGFIGSNLLETLLLKGQRVVGVDNFSTGQAVNLVQVRELVGEQRWRNFKMIEGDIRALEVCNRACVGVDVVLHQAALGSIPRSLNDPLGSHDSNVSGFLNMLVAARDAGVARFVYASSSSVYGDHPRLPKVESQLGRLLSPYALTKFANELYADVFSRCYGLETIGLRYFNVFGPRQRPDGAYAAVIPAWISALLNNEVVFINGDGKTARDFCYVENAVQANLLAAMVDEPMAMNQVYNVALSAQTSLNELFEMMLAMVTIHRPRVMDRQPVHRDFRQGDVRFSQADISKAHRLLGYVPRVRVKEGLAKTIAWHLARVDADRAGDRRVATPRPDYYELDEKELEMMA